MSAASNLAILAVLGVGAIALLAAFKAKLARQGGAADGAAPAFKAKALLTPNELEFLTRLESAVPELRFHAQVSMGALIAPLAQRANGKEFYRARGMFSQKIVDFSCWRGLERLLSEAVRDRVTHDLRKLAFNRQFRSNASNASCA